jgi:anti-sigma regulatory factor (Ser/Thr protein kinase)
MELRRLFTLLKKSSETDPLELPSLPSSLSYSELSFKVKRGFLARKIGHYLAFTNGDGDRLFYRSLTNSSINQTKNENQIDYLLYLGDLMLKWHEEQQNIVEQINSLPIRHDIQNAMLKVYHIYKQEIFPDYVLQEKRGSAQQDISVWEVYRDVIFAATQGQFLLISKEEVNGYKKGDVLCEGVIKERSDIPLCRNLAKDCLEKKGFNPAKVMGWILVLSEAISNIIKHAEEGRMTLVESNQSSEIHFIIEDKGPGFPLKELPKSTLLAGYSTKKSMGQGFTLMMKMTKQVSLFTSSEGSTIILTIDISGEKEGKPIVT